MKFTKTFFIMLFLAVFLCSCGKVGSNKGKSNASENTGFSEVVTYQIEKGEVDTDSFQFKIPESYVVDSTIDNLSIKNELKGITITIEENKDSQFDSDEYIGMLSQQFANFGIGVFEESPVDISGIKARKVHIVGLSGSSENDSMYCYFIPTKDNHLIVSSILKQDTKENVEEAEKIIEQIVIK